MLLLFLHALDFWKCGKKLKIHAIELGFITKFFKFSTIVKNLVTLAMESVTQRAQFLHLGASINYVDSFLDIFGPLSPTWTILIYRLGLSSMGIWLPPPPSMPSWFMDAPLLKIQDGWHANEQILETTDLFMKTVK